MSLNASDITTLLERYLPPELAAKRAKDLTEDLAIIGFELQLSNETPDGLWIARGAIPQAEYPLPDPGFSINSKDDNSALSGSFLTVGNLLRLSQVSAIGRQHIPALWPHVFGHRLCGREHMDALTEIWWLKWWRGLRHAEPGPKLNKASPDFEWSLTIHDGLAHCFVNLEVKRRPGNINALFKRRAPTARLGDAAKKFGPVPEDTANVIAVTTYFPVSDEIKRGVREWVDERPNVHGVLIWLEGNLGHEPMLKYFKPEKSWAAHLVREPEPEDLVIAGHMAGTLCSKEEMPAYLKALADGVPWHKHV
jgi:hypothetical protein